MTYATVDDMTTLWRPMTEAEQARAGPLLEVISASLDVEARKVGKDLPALVASDSALALVAKSVAVDVAARALMTSTDQDDPADAGRRRLLRLRLLSRSRRRPVHQEV
jgi:hypothetical protein